jgi:tripartite-type tricarboxylate transporter receptor subunit TctC
MKQKLTSLLMGALAAACISLSAGAQTYPNKPIRLINGFAAGGNADVVARLVAEKMSARLGQPIILESKPGAGTLIANGYVAKSDPDGYTLLLVSGAFPTSAVTAKSLTFDPVSDFAWVSMMISYPLAVVVKADSPIKSVQDLLAAAKARPGQLNYPSPGTWSLVHLAVELFNAEARVETVHIPFRGGAEPMTQLLAGRMDFGFETLTFARPQLSAGSVRAIAVTSRERIPDMKDVPAVAETLSGYEAISFLGIAAPAGTPPSIVEKLQQEVKRAVEDPEIQARFREMGGVTWANTPEAMKAFMAGEIKKWKDIAAARKIGG